MRILILAQFFEPDITAAAFRLSDFTRLLASQGHEVEVITAEPHKAAVDVVDDSHFAELGVRIHRCKIKHLSDGGGSKAYIGHYLSFVRSGIAAGLKIWRSGWKPDVIYASSPPLFIGLSGRFLSVLFRRPMVFEIRDIWPDAAVAAGQLSSSGWAYRIGRTLERYFYRKAKHLTCVSAPMKDYLNEQCQTPVTVVYNGVNLDSVSQPQINSKEPSAHKEILYAGNIGLLQNLDVLVTAFHELSQAGQIDGWKVRIIGAGAQREDVQELADQFQNPAISIEPPVSRDRVYRELRSADLLFLNLKSSETLAKSIPSKLFDYLLAARPILGGIEGEGQDILESTGANRCFRPGDKDDLKQQLLQMLGSFEQYEANARQNLELVKQRFSREAAVQELVSVFERVIQR
ncbi:MAG: glycosyltransferase family 4 protein [Pirellulaceae bacterium]